MGFPGFPPWAVEQGTALARIPGVLGSILVGYPLNFGGGPIYIFFFKTFNVVPGVNLFF